MIKTNKEDCQISFETFSDFYKVMRKIRTVEEKIVEEYPKNQIRCPTHLSIGQEAVPAALAGCITNQDFAVSTHRGHAHYLAKGADLERMICEIYGKASGCSQGKGGSMHLIDVSAGFMGTSAIVGNSIPIGVGLGLAIELKNQTNISCIYLGDGAIEEGVFYESLNFSVVRNLPILFICENNLYSVYSPLDVRQPKGRSIHSLASAIGSKSAFCDGNDVVDSYLLLKKVVSEIRSGSGPWFVEFPTYRWREHCGYQFDNDIGYRTEAEYQEWKSRDPIELFFGHSKKLFPTTSKEYWSNIDIGITNEVDLAFQKAKSQPFPAPEEAYDSVYAN
tara:strand:+ start:2049 stop:3050 length:1002 start_codon:yes stop_codon:yes gene_type:complete